MLRQGKLYKRKRPNRYLKIRRVPRTTLIVGAKCKDGVVLVGDRKVNTDFGVSYIEKIRRCPEISWAVFGAAGVGTLFEEFLEVLPQKVSYHYNWIQYQSDRIRYQHTQEFGENRFAPRPPEMAYSFADFKHDCVELLKEMRNAYSIAHTEEGCTLQILMGIRERESKLFYLDSIYCLPAEVTKIVFIGQSELGEVFRKSWDDGMTMAETAKLATFAIRYIEKEGISDGIGVGEYQPQVWFIPNDGDPREILGDKLSTLLADVEPEVEAIRQKLHSLFRF